MPSSAKRVPAIVLFFCIAATLSCSQKQTSPAGEGARRQPLRVKVKRAELEAVGEFIDYIATLKSRSSANIKPDVEGQITRIMVASGDRVEAGTALLEIDPRKQEASVNSQEANHRSKLANLEWNQSELERRKTLYAAGVISKQELEQEQAAYDAAKADAESMDASVREQRVQLRYYIVKAPSAGVVGDIPVRVGDRVTAATELTTIDQSGALEAYICVPSEKSAFVKLGTPVQIVDDTGKAEISAAVTFVSPRVDSTSQLLLAKAAIPNHDRRFRNNQLVHVRVVYSQKRRVLVPVTAIVRLSGQALAYVAETSGGSSVARQRPLVLGDIIGNDYVILDGIKSGEQLIISGTQMLGDGAPVRPES